MNCCGFSCESNPLQNNEWEMNYEWMCLWLKLNCGWQKQWCICISYFSPFRFGKHTSYLLQLMQAQESLHHPLHVQLLSKMTQSSQQRQIIQCSTNLGLYVSVCIILCDCSSVNSVNVCTWTANNRTYPVCVAAMLWNRWLMISALA